MTSPHRRQLLTAAMASGIGLGLGMRQASAAVSRGVQFTTSSESQSFVDRSADVSRTPLASYFDMDVLVRDDIAFQTVRGFGGCFNELGWVALSALPASERTGVLRELFAPDVGASFGFCRLPIGATDLSRSAYSLNDTPGDFAMEHFSIARDREMLIPFLKAALGQRPDMQLWASPWSPPAWMKANGHYACARPYLPSLPDNGLPADKVCHEGENAMLLDDRHLEAYALYFRRFIEAYRAEGLRIGAVMPQNEFNSAQPFPSCTWTPEGLAKFIPKLGRQMQPLGVDLIFGTLERGDDGLFEKVYADPEARKYIKGIGAQWAGRRAISFLHHAHPDLPIYQSEQECGDGANDWRFARYSFSLMKDFFLAGAEVYDYWNLATPTGGLSSWGWAQNALVSVDLKTGTARLNPDYHVLKQFSHFIKPGARRVDTLSINGTEDLVAFRNPDGGLVVVFRNAGARPQAIRVAARGEVYVVTAPADSIATLVV